MLVGRWVTVIRSAGQGTARSAQRHHGASAVRFGGIPKRIYRDVWLKSAPSGPTTAGLVRLGRASARDVAHPEGWACQKTAAGSPPGLRGGRIIYHALISVALICRIARINAKLASPVVPARRAAQGSA